MKEEKKPDSYSDLEWEGFIELRDGFIEALKDEDEAKINAVLDAHPDTQIPADDDNEAKTRIQWKDCPLKMTASYYANDKLEIEKMPVYEPEEIKQLIQKGQ